jgi:serine/threonine protein kinase
MARRKRSDDRMLLVPGEVVRGQANDYTVEAVVGSGAYATVYSATDGLGRKVALKEFVPSRHPRETPMLISLYERERFVLSLVSPHPLMPAFYDGFESDRHFYLAQEFIEGRSLDEVIATTKLNNEWMLRWAASLCYALSYLHSLQIVHHDLKPANIRIRPNGNLTLIDFGAARYFGVNEDLVPQSFTEDEELYGTEGYLPPEVEADGNFTADVRTDVFALGCILYEMVMGQPPEQKMINERMSFITTPLMSRKDINLDYVRLITTALSYNTDYRYATVQVFLDAIKPITPPFLMVSTKQLYFGRANAEDGTLKRKFTIFNGGSGGEFSGEVISRSPWITIEMPQFRGQKRDMVVAVDPSKVKQRNQLVRGSIEVWMSEKRDENNKIITPAEKELIECTVFIAPTAAKLTFAQPLSDDGQGYVLRLRKGVESSVALIVGNSGDAAADAQVRLPDLPGISASPSQVIVDGNSTAQIVVTAAPSTDIKTDTTIQVTLAWQKDQSVQTNIVVRPTTLVDGLLGLFRR